MKGYEILLDELRKMKNRWKVKDLMTIDVKTINPEAKVSEAIIDMKRYGIHGLIVTENEEPKGIITTYDALIIMARGESSERVLVKDVMSTELISTHPDDDTLKALEVMFDNQLTKLPVISEGKLEGILSATDLVDAFGKGVFEKKPSDSDESADIKLTIKEVMHNATIIDPEKTACSVAKIMTEKNIGSVLIEKNRVLGIVTERDIFKKIVAKGLDGTTIKASDIMSTPCYTIESNESIGDASKLFNEYDIRRLPVLEDGKIVGMVSARDIAKTISIRRRL